MEQVPLRMTVADFLAWESNDGLRYELVDGEPRALAPAGTIHGFLKSEIGSFIRNHLRDGRADCKSPRKSRCRSSLYAGAQSSSGRHRVTCSPLVPGQV